MEGRWRGDFGLEIVPCSRQYHTCPPHEKRNDAEERHPRRNGHGVQVQVPVYVPVHALQECLRPALIWVAARPE